MSYTALLEMKFKPGKIEEVIDAMSRVLPESREYEGCEGMTAHRSQDDPDTLIVLERWASPEAQAAYSAMRGEQVKAGPCDTATVIGNLAGAPSMRRLDDVSA